MGTERRAGSQTPTAAEQRYEVSGSITRSGSLPYERMGLKTFWSRLGRPNIQMRLWDGFTIGSPEGSLGTITFRNRSVLYQLLLSGEVAFGDGYSAGSIDVEGNLVDMLVETNMSRHNRSQARMPLEKLPLARFKPSNTLGRAQENIHHHYDVGNKFYQLWLDSEMQYTCAYFPEPEMTLEEAQHAKMDHVCRKLQLKPGDRVVEAGCGWGGFSSYAAKNFKSKIDAITISKEQYEYASNKIQKEGL